MLKSIIGGKITDYTKMLSVVSNEALQRMVADAKKKGANTVINMRFSTSMILSNAAEVLAYGTMVVLK